MMRRTLLSVVLVGLGVTIGYAAKSIQKPLACKSDNECFDQLAVTRCKQIGAYKATLKQRTVDLSHKAPLDGVSDWAFVVTCEGAPPPVVELPTDYTI